MNEQAWELLMKQLDRIEDQNVRQLDLLNAHIADDSKVKKTVERHSVYFSLLGLGVPGILGVIAKKLGWKD